MTISAQHAIAEFDELTNNNDHTAAAVALTFGMMDQNLAASFRMILGEIADTHELQGHMPAQLQQTRDNLCKMIRTYVNAAL